MSSYVDATPEAGAEAVEDADRPPPPSHRSLRARRGSSIDATTTAVLPDPTGPIPAGDGAAWHRTALLAASLAPGDEPPFLTEPTVAVPAGPPAALGQRLSELAYRRRALTAVAVAVLVLAAAAIVGRGGGSDGDGAEGPPSSLADGGAALMEPVRAALAAFGSTSRIAPSVASGSAGSAGVEPTTTTVPELTTTEAPTVPPTAPAPAEVPGTVQPRFCSVWVDGPLTVLVEPDDGAATAGQVGLGLYWVSAVTEDRPRWYLIDNGETRGWARGEDVDRQGDCRGRR
ncbi:MAG: hypothetical protein R2761_00360 [Acidimicrobiales bacterium]